MPRRIDGGAMVAAAGAALLLVSLFLDWFGANGEGFTAWTVFELLDIVLAALALLALAGFARGMGISSPAPDVPLLALGATALVLVVSQILNHPPAATELDPETGAWLGLAGAALLLAGAIMSVARISFSVEKRDRPAAPPPQERTGAVTETVRLEDPDRTA